MQSEQLDEFINDIHDTVVIMGITFDPADILRRLDPVAYKQEHDIFLQWQDLEYQRAEGVL